MGAVVDVAFQIGRCAMVAETIGRILVTDSGPGQAEPTDLDELITATSEAEPRKQRASTCVG